MSSGAVSTTNRSQIAVATGFLGAFIVGSLAVQMIRIQGGVVINSTSASTRAKVEPVVASPATLWAELGSSSDFIDQPSASSAVSNPAAKANVKPVVGSEATLWSDFGTR